MPIYRGAQKVHPMPGGMEVARVYRGDRLVYTSAPPRYIAGGSGVTWQGALFQNNRWNTRYTHTVTADGVASGTWSVSWNGSRSGDSYGVRVVLNGVTIATEGLTEIPAAQTQTVHIPETPLSAGDLLEFQSNTTASNSTRGGATASVWALS